MIGKPKDAHLIQALREEIPDRRMVLLYKRLKVAGTILWREIEPDWTPSQGHFKLGRPIDNMHVYILNDANVPLGVGGIGEVVVSGVGVSPDWYQASNFVVDYENDHPLFKTVPGAGRAVGFRTGDLGRFTAKGEIEYIGRKTNLVMVGGKMIDLDKMETRLGDYGSILDAAVVYKQGTESGEPGHLHAYLALELSQNPRQRGDSLYSQDLHDWLVPFFGRGSMPESYFLLAQIPRLPDGLIDIESLLEETAVTQLKDRPSVPPRSETEEKIAEIWRDLLLIDEVGVQDHFFDLGGDYMLALEMAQRVCAAFRVPFRFGPIYRNLTIERVSFIVNKRQTRTKIKIVR
ncbi:MAG: phosphopantetheine-binding protein [Chloroflexota bacterium]